MISINDTSENPLNGKNIFYRTKNTDGCDAVVQRQQSKKKMGLILRFSLVVSLLLSFLACSNPAPPDVEQAIRVVRYMSSANQLRRSSFLAAYSKGKPSQFVTWMFSPFGFVEWPYFQSFAESDPVAMEEAKSIRMPLVPDSVAIVPNFPDTKKG
ncbi:MAG: hypothetical protein ACE5EK_11105, partial [Nitrospinales bacterium]